jgi:hypothetical protein
MEKARTEIESAYNIVNSRQILSFERLVRICEALKNINQYSQKIYLEELEKLEQCLKVDIERKREIYAKEHGIEWESTLDPQTDLKKLSPDLPIIERVKIYLGAEASAEFVLRNFPLWKKFLVDGKISYKEYEEKSLKIFQEIFNTLSI